MKVIEESRYGKVVIFEPEDTLRREDFSSDKEFEYRLDTICRLEYYQRTNAELVVFRNINKGIVKILKSKKSIESENVKQFILNYQIEILDPVTSRFELLDIR